MSLPIWMRDALSSEQKTYSGKVWRLVEAQHQVSTLKLVDSLAAQDLLELLLEQTKPAIPLECRHLDLLLSTPFRYDSPYPHGSCFRAAGKTEGVFYAAENVTAALAEMAFYRLLFFAESPSTPLPQDAAELTAFSCAIASGNAIDLTHQPFAAHDALWSDFSDYREPQRLVAMAREVDVDLLRYRSIRDPEGGSNLAILMRRVFAEPRPLERQTWRMRVSATGVQALCEFPRARVEFTRLTFSADPRIAVMWLER
jgi:hypothetical protein